MNARPSFLISAFCLLLSALPLYADYHPIEVIHGGSIRGKVKYPTESAPRAMFANHNEPNCPGGIPQEHLFVKQENRGIKNVLIVLDISQGKPLKPLNGQLDNKGCRFVPRVQWISKSSSLFLNNSDPTAHNVHLLRNAVTTFSVDVPPRRTSLRRPLVDTGLYKINCDLHLWMRAWIYVSDHPYVAITDTDGRFELTDVPPGTYILRAWHEGWEEKGTEHTGQPFFQPMQQEMRVKVRREDATEVLLDTLVPVPLSKGL